jgi:hypothetical protein
MLVQSAWMLVLAEVQTLARNVYCLGTPRALFRGVCLGHEAQSPTFTTSVAMAMKMFAIEKLLESGIDSKEATDFEQDKVARIPLSPPAFRFA